MPALDAADFAAQIAGGAIPLDLRTPAHFAQAHIPGSVFLQFGKLDLGDRAELFLAKDLEYVLVMEPAALGPVAEKLLSTAGYRVQGFLQGGMKGWANSEHSTASIPTTTVHDLHRQLAAGEAVAIIDVREDFEYDWGHVEGAVNIPHGEIWDRVGELDGTRHWHVICNDQVRSAASASILRRLGLQAVTLVLGGTVAWMAAEYALTNAG